MTNIFLTIFVHLSIIRHLDGNCQMYLRRRTNMASSVSVKRSKGVAIVTGASAGMGKAIVRLLLADGWTVYGGARRVDQMADLTAEGAKVLQLDVTEEASMTNFVNAVVSAEGRIDALVNNAGYGSYG